MAKIQPEPLQPARSRTIGDKLSLEAESEDHWCRPRTARAVPPRRPRRAGLT